MHQLYLLSVWLHLVAVAAWMGGMLFLAGVVLPVLRRGDPVQLGRFMSGASGRFRFVGWTCLGVLGLTGFFQLAQRGLSWNSNPLVLGKIGLFCVIVVMSVVHDFWAGPKASSVMLNAPGSPQALRWRRVAILMGRLTGVLALAMTALGVFIVRGLPW